MSLNETMERLKAERNEPKAVIEKDEPLVMLDLQPTIRDLATALYMQRQGVTCRNCLRRERGNCPSKTPMPKTCISFQLNSKQMQTYGAQAKNAIKAFYEAIAIFSKRTNYNLYRDIKED